MRLPACAGWRSRWRFTQSTKSPQRISEFLEMRMPEGLLGKLKMLPKLAEMGAFFPKMVSSGPCKDSIRHDNFSLDEFPILHCWPEDGGRYITLPMVFSNNPDTGKRNCGCYRMQVFDERTTGMHWQTHKQGAEHYRRCSVEKSEWRSRLLSAPIRPRCIRQFCRCRPISMK